jgi:hypothetical protein
MSGRSPQEDTDVAVWSAPVRVLLLSLLFGFVGVGVVVALYDRGFLPIAGPFVALAVAPFLGFLGVLWVSRRHRALSRQVTHELGELLPALEEERRLPREQRPSGATDETLDAALGRARSALSQLSWGHDEAGISEVDALARVARPWSSDATVARGVGRTVDLSQRLRRSRRRVERQRSRRPSSR